MTSDSPAPHSGLSTVKAAKLAAVGLLADRKERRELERPVEGAAAGSP